MTETSSALLLDDLARFVRRFVVLSETQTVAVALWIAHTHAVEAADTTPYLALTSAEKRSGKSRLLEVIELLVRSPLPTASISDAALYRAIDALSPTLLLDEADGIFGKRNAHEREDLRRLLNAGWRRGAVARRMGGARMTTLEEFPVFCPKAFAGIGDYLPDTLSDRAIWIRLERRTRDEPVERFRRREVVPEGEGLRARLADWLEPQVDHLRAARPALPEKLDDRAQDFWEPLLAIADLAGGEWPERARQVAVELSTGETREDDSLSARLLADIRTVFKRNKAQRFKTADLIEHLSKIEESPWGDWHGKPISAQALSKLLRPYRIKTMPVKVEGQTVRGYKVEQFSEAFYRVLGVTRVTRVTPEFPRRAAGNASNAGNAQHAGEGTNRTPILGDPDYLAFIAGVHENGHITTEEALELERLHGLIEKATAVKRDGGEEATH
jgi:Protein of unknown function (DUF3631)